MVDELSAPTPTTPMPARLAHTLRRAPKHDIVTVMPAPISVTMTAPVVEFEEMPLPAVDGTPVIAMDETTVPVAAEPVPAPVVVEPPPAHLMVAPVAPLPVEPAFLAVGSTTMPVEVFHVPEVAVEPVAVAPIAAMVIDPPVAPARSSRMHDLLIGLGIGGGVLAGVLVALALI